MKFRIADSARTEFGEAARWYESRQSGLGEEFTHEVELAFRECRDRPLSCSVMERYRGSRNVRRVIVRRFSYVVVFQVLKDEVRVIAIGHSGRRPLYWADRVE